MAIVIPSARCFSTHRRAFVLGNALCHAGRAGELGFTKHGERVRLEASSISRNTVRAYVFVHPPSPEIVTTCCVKESALSAVARPAYNFIHGGFPSRSLAALGVSSRVHFRSKRRIRTPADPSSFIPPVLVAVVRQRGHAGHTRSLSFSRSLSLPVS